VSGVELRVAEGVARITIDRPERMNSLDREAAKELSAHLQAIDSDPSVRVAVLTGAGDRAFCAGADLKADPEPASAYWLRDEDGFGGLGLRRRLAVPVIARVNGAAMGGGLELVLGCDLAVAAASAVFGLPEVTIGRIPLGGGAVSLPRQIPRKLALQLLLTGEAIDAEEALRFGLVNSVVPSAELDDATERLVEAVLGCSRSSLRAILAIVDRTGHLPIWEARAMRLPEVVEAMREEDEESSG